MIDILTPKVAENDLCQQLVHWVEKCEDAREEYYRQCLVNVLFLYGRHHFTANYGGGGGAMGSRILWEINFKRNPSDNKRVCNYILPLFRSVYSRLIRQKANVFAEPTTSTEKDRNAARVSKEVSEDFWVNCNRNNPWLNMEFAGMQSVLMRLILYKMALGMGYLIPYFNPRAKSFVYDQMRRDVIEAEVGEAEVRVAKPMDIFRDRFGRWIVERRYISPEQVEYEFGVKVDPEKRDDQSWDSRMEELLDGDGWWNDGNSEGVYVYQKHCIPSAEYPDGRKICCTQKQVLFDGPLPPEAKQKINIFEFRYQDLGFSKTGQGAIEQVIDLQQDLNYTLSRISQHKKLMTGKVMVPHNAKMQVAWDSEVGQIIRYAQGFKPSYQDAAHVPTYFFQELERIRRDMEDLMNSHDSSMGQTPGQVKSGVGIQNLAERDDAQIAPELIMFEQRLGFFTESILDIAQVKYQERRLLTISGDDLAFEIKSFIGSDLFGQKNVQVKLGSNLPLGKEARTQYILMLKKEGFIPPDRAKELLEYNDVDGAFKSLDETAAKQDILNIIEGQVIVIAEPWEDHTIFLKVINDFRKGSMFAKLPEEVRQRVNDLAGQHQQYLLQEQQAAASMGAPLPTPAAPNLQKQEGA